MPMAQMQRDPGGEWCYNEAFPPQTVRDGQSYRAYKTVARDSTVIMKSLGVRMRWLFRLVGMSLILPVCVSCALFRERPVETAPTIVLPEVRKITFTGNTQFSSRTLIGEMVSK